MKVSDLARPPIRPEEIAGKVEEWICPYHNGLISVHYRPDEVGKVYLCPVGRMYYRFTDKQQGGLNSPLKYNHEGII